MTVVFSGEESGNCMISRGVIIPQGLVKTGLWIQRDSLGCGKGCSKRSTWLMFGIEVRGG